MVRVTKGEFVKVVIEAPQEDTDELLKLLRKHSNGNMFLRTLEAALCGPWPNVRPAAQEITA